MGASFELTQEVVLGHRMTVFADRRRSLRELLHDSLEWGDRDYLVDGDRRLKYADHHRAVARVAAAVTISADDEICVRGPMVMLGYWHNQTATDAVIDGERWRHTGDLGEIRDGLLYLSTRRTDLILRGAETVYPAQIESCLESHAGVAEVAVVGVPDEEFGQLVVAVVVPTEGQAPDPVDLASHVRQHLAYFKVPARWVVRSDPLPRTATGKVVRSDVLDSLKETT